METMDTKEKLVLASIYLEDAFSGRHMEFMSGSFEIKLYLAYKKKLFKTILFAALILDLSLALYEDPAVLGMSLPHWITISMELVCLAVFFFRFFHELLFTQRSVFWADTRHIVTITLLVLTVIDIIVYTIMWETAAKAYRWTRVFRPFFIVNFPEGRQIRQAFRNIRRTLPEICNVLILFLLTVALCSLMVNKLFEPKLLTKVNGDKYFDDFWDSFWDMYVLITTANNPDLMMPAYDLNGWFSLIFIVYIIVCLFIFMSVILAVVYNEYKSNLKNEVRVALERKRALQLKVFELLNEPLDGKEVVTKSTFIELLRLAIPHRSETYIEVLWHVLDVQSRGFIDQQDFMQLSDLLNVNVSEVTNEWNLCARYMPTIYNSPPSQLLIKGIKHKTFRYSFDMLILVNAIFIGFKLDGGEAAFLAMFTLEIVLKLYAFGVRSFFQKLWNIFDVIVVSLALIVTILGAIDDELMGTDIVLDVLMILRVMRIFKIFHSIARYRVVMNTIMYVIPSLTTYGGIMFIIFYVYAIIGMEIYNGLISYYGYDEATQSSEQKYCGNPHLRFSEFYKNHYCSINFNNVLSSFFVLFHLMVVNQWHVVAHGYVLVTNKYSRLFFITFHIICVIVILNIFTAFVLEAFMLEYSFSKSPMESRLLSKINEMGLGYGSRPTKSRKAGDDGLLIDADHTGTQFESDPSVLEQGDFEDYSNKTHIRFHLFKQKRTLQNVLERMFERELKE